MIEIQEMPEEFSPLVSMTYEEDGSLLVTVSQRTSPEFSVGIGFNIEASELAKAPELLRTAKKSVWQALEYNREAPL